MDPAIVQQMSNQQTTVNEQPCTQINGSKQVPFDILLPILIRQLDQDRSIELQTLFDKLKRDEVPKHQFVRLMKGIVGKQMLIAALTEVQQQRRGNLGSAATVREITNDANTRTLKVYHRRKYRDGCN